MDGLSELLATADEFYGLLPEEFTTVRDGRVRVLRSRGGGGRVTLESARATSPTSKTRPADIRVPLTSAYR